MSGKTRDGRRIPDAAERPPPAQQPPRAKYTQAELDHAVADALEAEREAIAVQAERFKERAEKQDGMYPVALALLGVAEFVRSRMRASQ